MDLSTAKAKRDARIKDKKERIKTDMGAPSVPQPTNIHEEVSSGDTEAETKVKASTRKKPEKKVE